MLDVLLFTFNLDVMGDYLKQRSGVTLCAGCGSQILDQYILRVSPDLKWHAACLKCAKCSQYLDETCTCFIRDGKTYCKRDYVWLFGIKCAKCNNGIDSNDLVMRAHGNVYHMECFHCTVCSRALLPGDEFLLRDEGLLCRADHAATKEWDESLKLGHMTHGRPISQLIRPPDPVSVRRTPLHRHHVHSSEKSTRVRTVLNEKQLHTLRTCYNANPRPDALMKEQLVEMTGLSPRVIRVWFQNKRCKDKKRSLLIRQRPQQGDRTNLQGLTGTLLTVTSPVHHHQTSEGEFVEVHTHQPLWKSFNKFTQQRALKPHIFQVSLSDSLSSSSGSEVSLSSDTPNSMVLSPGDT